MSDNYALSVAKKKWNVNCRTILIRKKWRRKTGRLEKARETDGPDHDIQGLEGEQDSHIDMYVMIIKEANPGMWRHKTHLSWFIVTILLLGCMIAASQGENVHAAQAVTSPTSTPTSTNSPTSTDTSTPTFSPTSTSTSNVTSTPVAPAHVVISEFRTRGPNGESDEFVELYNPTGAAVNISNWTIKWSSDCGISSSYLVVIAANTILQAGQHYLLASTTGGSITNFDQLFLAGLTDAGGLALINTANAIVDQVGMCISTLYREGTNLEPITGDADQSYERKPGGETACYDTDNNTGDFVLISPSNPQNRASAITLCNGVSLYTPTSTITLTRTNTPTLTRTPTRTATTIPGSVVINEFLPHPHTDWNEDGSINVGDEYIELLNMGTSSINIKNWTLDNGPNTTAYNLPDMNMLPHQILVFFHFETGIPLSDGGGSVRLRKSDGRTADNDNYPPVEAVDRTWCRLPSGSEPLTFACRPSPGRPNIPFNVDTPTPVPEPGTNEEGKCNLSDIVPPEMASVECGGIGAGVWNQPLETQFWLPSRWKWAVFVE